MIRCLFCDLDDTVFDFHAGEANAIRKTLMFMDVDAADSVCRLYSEINTSHWRMLERGEITRAELLVRRFACLYAQLGITRDAQKTQMFYETALAEEHIFLPGAEDFLRAASERVPLYAVTNGTASIQKKRIADANIGRYFKGLFISEEIGWEKPSCAFFDACFGALPGLVPAETMMLGDSLTSDMQGGMNAGLVTCWFNPAGKSLPDGMRVDYTVEALAEVIPLLS